MKKRKRGRLAATLAAGDACAICLAAMHAADLVKQLGSCGHAYHAACLDEWLRRSNLCPLCKRPATAAPGLEAKAGQGIEAVVRRAVSSPVTSPLLRAGLGHSDGGKGGGLDGGESSVGDSDSGAEEAGASSDGDPEGCVVETRRGADAGVELELVAMGSRDLTTPACGNGGVLKSDSDSGGNDAVVAAALPTVELEFDDDDDDNGDDGSGNGSDIKAVGAASEPKGLLPPQRMRGVRGGAGRGRGGGAFRMWSTATPPGLTTPGFVPGSEGLSSFFQDLAREAEL